MMRTIAAFVAAFVFALPAVAASCTVSATSMSFAPYNAFSGLSVDSTSTVTVTCTGLLFVGVSYEVRLDGGQEGNILARKMAQGASANELGYQVYLDAGRSTVWGNGVQGSSFTGTMLLGLLTRIQTRTVYGRIPASQQVNAGAYGDTPVMTIIY